MSVVFRRSAGLGNAFKTEQGGSFAASIFRYKRVVSFSSCTFNELSSRRFGWSCVKESVGKDWGVEKSCMGRKGRMKNRSSGKSNEKFRLSWRTTTTFQSDVEETSESLKSQGGKYSSSWHS